MRCLSKDELRLLSKLLDPVDKVRLSRCNKRFYGWLKDYINVDEWNHISSTQGMKRAYSIQCDELVEYFSNKFLHSENYCLQPKPLGRTGQAKLTEIIKTLLNETEILISQKCKVKNAYRVFEWISRNTWLLTHRRFQRAIKNKLIEFEKIEEAEIILQDFGWMITADFNDETIAHTKYGRTIKSEYSSKMFKSLV